MDLSCVICQGNCSWGRFLVCFLWLRIDFGSIFLIAHVMALENRYFEQKMGVFVPKMDALSRKNQKRSQPQNQG